MYFKIVERLADKTYRTLYHGVLGSRELPLQTWLKAEKKTVTDGGMSRDTQYTSGWHVFKEKDQAISYLDNFKTEVNRVVIKCYTKNIRPKEHSRSNVYLADSIYIPKNPEV